MSFKASETNSAKTGAGQRPDYRSRGNVRRILTHLTPEGVDVPVAEYAIPVDGAMKVVQACSNMGHDELMRARRQAKGRRPPLTDVQRRAIYDRKMAQTVKDASAGVRSPEDRLRTALLSCDTIEEKEAVIAGFRKANGASIDLTASAGAVSIPKPTPKTCDIPWLYRALSDVRDAQERGLYGATEAAEARMKVVNAFDTSTVPDREMLETLTVALIGRKRLMTPQEREALVNRVPVAPAPATDEETDAPAAPLFGPAPAPAKV